jgi:hypothetical protein
MLCYWETGRAFLQNPDQSLLTLKDPDKESTTEDMIKKPKSYKYVENPAIQPENIVKSFIFPSFNIGQLICNNSTSQFP